MRSNGHSEAKSCPTGNFSVITENTAKIGRLSVSQNADAVEKETKSLGRLPLSANSNSMTKESRISAGMSMVCRSFCLSKCLLCFALLMSIIIKNAVTISLMLLLLVL